MRSRRTLELVIALGLVLAASSATSAEEPPLTTDRPDQCDSPFIVPHGLFQVEGGLSHGRRDDDGGRLEVTGFPEALLRFGVTDAFELRLGVPGFAWQSTDITTGEVDDDGLLDVTAGFKARIAEQRGAVPHVAFVGTLVIPSGDRAFRSNRIDPGFRFAFNNSLTETISLTYNVGMFWLTLEDEVGREDTRSLLDWALTASFATGPRLGFFAEVFGVTGASDTGPPRARAGGGVTWLWTSRLQLDARVTAGLTSAALDWTAGVGVSWRFPGVARRLGGSSS